MAAGTLCDVNGTTDGSCWLFQLVISYDNAFSTSEEDVRSDMASLRNQLFANASLNRHHVLYRAGVSGNVEWSAAPFPLFTWSEATEEVYDAVISEVFGAGTAPVVRVARNARQFATSVANFEWVGTMSTSNTVTTNWGEQYVGLIGFRGWRVACVQSHNTSRMSSRAAPRSRLHPPFLPERRRYLLDFRWIMARQQSFESSTNTSSINTVMAGSVWPGFNDTFVPMSWNGGVTRVIARDVAAGLLRQGVLWTRSVRASVCYNVLLCTRFLHSTNTPSLSGRDCGVPGNTMNLTWEAQLGAAEASPTGLVAPDCAYAVHMPWIQVVTWNDWPEGTSVEPSDPRGYGFEPLLTTHRGVSRFKSVAPLVNDADTLHVLQLPLRWYKAAATVASHCANFAECTACGQPSGAPQPANTCQQWSTALASAELALISRDAASAHTTLTQVEAALASPTAAQGDGSDTSGECAAHLFWYDNGTGKARLATDDCIRLLGAAACSELPTVEWPADPLDPHYVKFWLLQDFPADTMSVCQSR